jgi:thioredoxin-like negative regulator of GroEL
MNLALEIDATERRLLSNSFNAAGNWSASWVLDSGPLFWFVGPGLPEGRELTDLSRFFPDLSALPPDDRVAWQRMIVERARFRRAIGEPTAALEAMPLSAESFRGMHTRLQLATNARPSAGAESELPPLPDRLPADPRLLWAAEGGDLLYAHGERERAAELLAESAAGGWAPALGALARWQFRAGEDEAARHTIIAMADAEATRDAAIEMVPWLLARQRTADARLVLEALAGNDARKPTAELGARLHVLSAQALVPPPTLPRPEPEEVSRR